MVLRLAIVDDDIWVRAGRAHLLSCTGEFQVVAVLGHVDAIEQSHLLAEADVVLVDAYDPRPAFDHFPGVAVTKAIRRHGPHRPAVVAISGHVANELLRLRMAECGADLFYSHDEVADLEQLAQVIRNAAQRLDGADRPTAPAGSLHPEAVLEWVQSSRLEAAFSGESQKSLPMSRRLIMRVRREVGETSGLARSGAMPPWRQVTRFVNRARGADLVPGDGE